MASESRTPGHRGAEISKRKPVPPAKGATARTATARKTVPFTQPRTAAAPRATPRSDAGYRSRKPFQESTKPNLNELGMSGTKMIAGLLYEETNPQLQGINGFKKYHEMRFDPSCAAALKAVEYPIRSARHFVEPASDDPAHILHADFVHDQLYNFGSQSMDDIIRLAFTMLPFGFSWHEICYAYIEQGDWAGKVGWDKFAWRSQATKWRWNMGEIEGRQELMSVTQLAPPYYQAIDIPRDKLLIFSNDQEGDNFDGWSALRAAYKPYYYRDLLYRIQAIGLQRAYVGIPGAKLPKGYSKELQTLVKQVVENLRTDETAGFVVPDDVILDVLFNKVNGDAMQKAIDHHDTQIPASMLAQMLKLGTRNTGSFALSSDQSEMFLDSLNGKANYFDQVFNLDPGIPLLIRYNFANADDSKMPQLRHGDIGQRALEKMGRTLEALAKNGFITPDDATEDKLRQMLDLPERDNSITDRALADLVEQVFPREQDRGRNADGSAPRLRPSTLVDPNKPADMSPDGNGAEFSEERAAKWQELQRAWQQKPFRRASNIRTQRTRILNSERLIDSLSEVRHGMGDKPERPSLRMARLRRPYRVLPFAEEPAPSVVPVESPAPPPYASRMKPHVGRIEQALRHVGPRGR